MDFSRDDAYDSLALDEDGYARFRGVVQAQVSGPDRWITYSPKLDRGSVRWIWKRTFCRLGIHLFDQVESLERRYLFCDACELEVPLRSGRIIHGDAEI